MKRETLIPIVVLLDIADDYESLDHVVQDLARIGERCRITFNREEAKSALRNLIRSGLAKAYRLSNYPAKEINGIPSSEDFEDDYTYFYITPEGLQEIHRMRNESDWPFDDMGDFRLECCPE